ncbi:iron ABC transporter permease [Nocardioides dubius]|uniref:Iron ABC transporter permease n=1 Tax=Nocardioides dubius TaxID=317019 RepID=A0ABP4EQ67_9ACTN
MAATLEEERSTGLRGAVVLGAGVALLLVCAAISLLVGKGDVSPVQAWTALVDPDPTDSAHLAVRTVRVPRTWLAILVGAALAVSGALIQVLTRNALAEPGLLGVSAGASFAVVLVSMVLSPGQTLVLVAALVGATAAALVVLTVGRGDPLRLVLAGTALSAVLMGWSLAIRIRSTSALDAHRYWSVGSLAGREQTALLLPSVVLLVALVAAALLVRPLSALSLGDDVASGLGVPVARTRIATAVTATALAAVATAVAGPIVFVGLIVPHLVRQVVPASVGWLVGLSALLGPTLLLVSDILARVVLPTGDMPVAVITAVIGGPVLIWVVRRYGVSEL